MASLVNQASRSVDVIDMSGNNDLQGVLEGNKAAIKHPMSGARESHPVTDNVRTILLDWPDMGCCDFGAPPSVNQLETGDSATFAIGTEHYLAKNSVSHDA